MSNWTYDEFGVLVQETKPRLPIPEGYYQSDEMAEILGVKHYTIAKYCREGKLPAHWYKPTGHYGKWIVEAKVFDQIVKDLSEFGYIVP